LPTQSRNALSWPDSGPVSQQPPLVTVAIPCHNSADFVGDAIRSVLNQTWKPVEIIVVDDASTDASRSVIASFDRQVKVIPLPANKGASFARNRAAEASTGNFILFLDADDLLGADALAAMVATSITHKGSIAACRFYYLVAEHGTWRRVAPRARRYGDEDQLLAWLEGNWSPPCALLWPRNVYESIGGWNESLTRNDDGDIAMRALARGVRITSTDRGEVFYRRHKNTRPSLSTTRASESHLKSGVTVLTSLADDLARQGRLEPYRHAIREDLAELARLAFKAGFEILGSDTVAIARSIGSKSPEPVTWSADSANSKHDGRSVRFARGYATAVRSRGQLRRWLKRRSGWNAKGPGA